MDKNKEILKNILNKQISEGGNYSPCPRCGKDNMRNECVKNALSRYENVYICSECGVDEALNGQLPLDNWNAVINLYKY